MAYTKYDVIIVGGGPGGLFAALELCAAGVKTVLVEKGRDIDHRHCLVQEKDGSCPECSPCHVVSGLGGAGAFSDGKLTLSTEVGGRLKEIAGEQESARLIDYVDRVYLKFGAPNKSYGEGDLEEISRRAIMAEMRLIPVKTRHMGTDRSREVLKAMRDHLAAGVEIRTGQAATSILTDNGAVQGVEMDNGEVLHCRYLVLAPGREGADWLTKEAERLNLTLKLNPVDVGVRVEVPAAVLEELTSVLYECKLEFFSRSFNDRIRTFCMCPNGEVITEISGGADPVITVNGNSYSERKTANTNFALLVSTTFTEPFREPIAYGKYLARLANILSGGVLVQKLGDLLQGHRSTPERIRHGLVQPTLRSATPGDLSFALPYRHLKGIVEMLEAMDKLAPGVASRHTLLYGVEVKFYSSQLKLSPCLETETENLFACGDGAGVSRGLVQASASGVVAAREILKRLDKTDVRQNCGRKEDG